MSQRLTPDGPFGAGVPVAEINTEESEGTTWLDRQALTLYFFSTRPGGPGGRDLYVATRNAKAGAFASIRRLANVNSASNDHMPWVGVDGLSIYFTSSRPASFSGNNLWLARRRSTREDFDAPEELPSINSDDMDESPALSADQLTLLFTSNRASESDADIWMSTRDNVSQRFSEPQPVSAVNSASGEYNITLSSDGRELIFSSARNDEVKLYRSLRACRQP